MNVWLKRTIVVVVGAIALLVAWDVLVAARSGYEATISYLVLTASATRPVFTVAAGLLCGHLFWFRPAEPRVWDRVLLVNTLGCLVIACVMAILHPGEIPPLPLLFVGSAPLGRLFWAQPEPVASPPPAE